MQALRTCAECMACPASHEQLLHEAASALVFMAGDDQCMLALMPDTVAGRPIIALTLLQLARPPKPSSDPPARCSAALWALCELIKSQDTREQVMEGACADLPCLCSFR